MEIIRHRVNNIEMLEDIPADHGVEIDIRSNKSGLYLHHDPFVDGVAFESWLENYRHGSIILNVKEEGLEKRVLELLEKYKIKKYFFLDQSIPFLIKTYDIHLGNSAARISEFEDINTIRKLRRHVKWVWIDCFTKLPISTLEYETLRSMKLNLCLVSPELQGRTDPKEVSQYIQLLKHHNIKADAVCTKYPDLWT